MLGDNMTQIKELLLGKSAFTELDVLFVVLQNLKDNSQVVNVFLHSFVEYQYIIHEKQDKPSHALVKNCIHQALECRRCISKPK
jgi:hypothetical protein